MVNDLRLITGFSIILFLLAIVVAVWYFLGPFRVALSKAGIAHQIQRKASLLFTLFLLVLGLPVLLDIILELINPYPSLFPVNEYKYPPSWLGFIARPWPIHAAAVVLLLALLLISVALLVPPRSWSSRNKRGWILFVISFIPGFFRPLLTMKLTDIWHPAAIDQLTINLYNISFALFLAAMVMFLISEKRKKKGQGTQRIDLKGINTLLHPPPSADRYKDQNLTRRGNMLLHYIVMILRGTNPFIIMKAKRLFEKYDYEIGLADLEAHYLALGGNPSFDEFMAVAQIIFERKEVMDFKKLCALQLTGHIDEIKDGKTLAEIIEEVKRAQGEDIKRKGLEGCSKK